MRTVSDLGCVSQSSPWSRMRPPALIPATSSRIRYMFPVATILNSTPLSVTKVKHPSTPFRTVPVRLKGRPISTCLRSTHNPLVEGNPRGVSAMQPSTSLYPSVQRSQLTRILPQPLVQSRQITVPACPAFSPAPPGGSSLNRTTRPPGVNRSAWHPSQGVSSGLLSTTSKLVRYSYLPRPSQEITRAYTW